MAAEDAGAAPLSRDVEARVVEIVRDLARETGGARAERAASETASLEREIGLGSLERVELLVRLERTFERALPDSCLALDTARELARAVLEAPAEGPVRLAPAAPPETRAAAVGTVRTLQESLWRHAALDPQRTHAFLREHGAPEEAIGYGRLWAEAAAVAGGLRERGVAAGDTVGLMLPTGLDFLRAFMGTMAAGAVPVPIYPPVRLDRLSEYAERQAAILADAGVRQLVTVARARPVAGLLRAAVPTLDSVVTAGELAEGAVPLAAPVGRASDVALVQYTSGSTGRPKGVVLSHENLLANIAAIATGLALEPTDVGVSWLPLYHDMGLIGSWLFCLHLGLPLTLLPPTAFLTRPERWLWAIHERRATLSPAPNFAYELCARRIPDRALAGLDLSSWRVALNGAEPVSPGTLERFCARFGGVGFRRSAMMPVYGLAEASVALAFPPVGRGPRIDRVSRTAFQTEGRAVPAPEEDGGALEMVAVGRPLAGHAIRILGEGGHEMPERHVGRIVFRGPSATSGYLRQPEATAEIAIEGGWLDSGDLGYRADGELFVCGRHKDLIIKGGRNLVPQEIEEAAADAPGVRRGCVAAIGVPSAALGTEALVVVAETRERERNARERLEAAVTARVADAVGVPPDSVVLVEPGAVPKTPSGKVRRSATRDLLVSGKLGAAPVTTLGQRARLAAGAVHEWSRPWGRRVLRAAYAVWLAATLTPTLALAWLLTWLAPTRGSVRAVCRHGCRLALRLVGCRLERSGARLPAGPLVLACNHASYVDVPALLALLDVPFVFVAKREVLSNPFLALFARRGSHLTVDRFDVQRSVAGARAVRDALQSGACVLFFPEGTFTAATGLRPFRLGAFEAAATTGVPVVPLALRGTREVMRGDWRLPRPGRVRLEVGEPILPDGTGMPALVRLRDRVREAIAARCGEPCLDAAPDAGARR